MALQQAALDGLGEVERRYVFEEPEELRTFLEQHPYLIPLLAEARTPIARLFGPTATVRLELLIDPDSSGPESDALYGIIHSSLDVDAALDALQAFGDQWWLEEIPRAHGYLGFDIGSV